MSSYTDKGNVNYWIGGQAQGRATAAVLAGEIDKHMWAVFIVMAGLIKDEKNPVCWASYGRIANRCGISINSVRRSVERLVVLGWLVKLGKATVGTGREGYKTQTVRYQVILSADWEVNHSPSQGDKEEDVNRSPSRGDKDSPSPGDKDSPSQGDKSESSSVSAEQAHREDDDRDAAGADGPGGPPLAAPLDGVTPKPGIYAEIAERRGCSPAEAERWAGRRIDGAGSTVRNEVAYLRRCLDNEDSAPASGGRPASKSRTRPPRGVPSAAQRRASLDRRRPRNTFSNEEIAAVVAASRAGEAHAEIAEGLNVTLAAVHDWRQDADRRDAEAAVCKGEPVEKVAERLGMEADDVRSRHERSAYKNLLAALRAGEPVDSLAGKFNVDAEFVDRVHTEETARIERLAHEQRVRPDVVAALDSGAAKELVSVKFNVTTQFVEQVRREQATRSAHEQRMRANVVSALNSGELNEVITTAFDVTTQFVEKVRRQEDDRARREAEYAAAQEQKRVEQERRHVEREAQLRRQRAGVAVASKPWDRKPKPWD